jgi:photosystem II stability/assembly factor-like uncharacterized protein
MATIARDAKRRSIIRLTRGHGASALIHILALLCALLAGLGLTAGAAGAASYNVWGAQNTGPTQTLYGVSFVGQNTGWVVGAYGTIRYTANGGANWAAQTSGTSQQLNDASFTDANNGWAVGSYLVIDHTTNGGSTWAPQTLGGRRQYFYGVAFADASNGWAVGSGGLIYHTSNGTTWSRQTSGTSQNLQAIAAASSTTAWAVGSGGTIRCTTNGGTTWAAQTSGTTQSLNGVVFIDANNGWAVGNSGVIVHTSNGGTTWSLQTSPTTQNLNDVVASNGTLWATGSGSTVLTCLVDTTLPVTAATGLQSDNHVGWVTGGQLVTLNASDSPSGIAATFYTVNGGSRQTYLVPFTISGDGAHPVTYWSVDNGGNTEAAHNGYVNIDSGAPATLATGLQADRSTGWRSTAQQVTLTPSDALSGVKATYYTIDDGGQQTYSAPFSVGSNGSHHLTYWSVDNAGNIESIRDGYVNIDGNAPATVATGLQSDASTGWRNTAQQVTLTPSDALSGIAATYYRIDGGTRQTYSAPFSVAGQSHTVTYWSIDTAGNTEGAQTGFVNIDTTPPTVQDSADSLWHNHATTVHINANDAGGSGVAATFYRQQGSSTWLPATASAFVVPAPPDGSGDGSHAYQYEAVDGAGNSSVAGACTVWIDTTAPTSAATGLQANNHSGWRTSPQIVSLTHTDGSGSGVATTYYSLDGAPQQAYSTAFTVSTVGQHAVTYWSVDSAGNTETHHTGWVNIGDPYVQAAGLADDDHSGWRNTPCPVSLTTSGANVPITVHYSIDNGPASTSTTSASFTISSEGVHAVDYYATDSYSTESIEQTGYANIDTTDPSTEAHNAASDPTAGWSNASVVVTLDGSDALSGVAATYYAIDTGSQTTYSGPFVVSSDGSHAITYWSVDKAGNAETPQTAYVNIDTTVPTVTDDSDSPLWHAADVTVHLTPQDDRSGVASTWYRVQGDSTWLPTTDNTFTVSAETNGSNDGATVYEYRVVDKANNETTGTCTVGIDTQGPTVSSDADAYWHNSAVTVNLTASDLMSGVKDVSYRPEGASTWTTTSGDTAQIAVPSSPDGLAHTYSYDYEATDACGNASAVHTLTVQIDPRMPNTTLSGLPTHAWTHKSVSLTYTATPGDGAPIVRTEYSVDGGTTWANWAAGTSLVVSKPGPTALLYRSVNAAGTTEYPARQASIRIDTGKPTTVALKNVTATHGLKAKLPYKVSDPKLSCGSAKATVLIYLKARLVKKLSATVATNKSVTISFTVKLKRGTYRWVVKATDIAGNVQAKAGSKLLYIR